MAPNPIFQTGFEHGVADAGGGTLFTGMSGTPAISSSIKHGGSYAMRYNAASGASVYHQISLGGNSSFVGVFYVYVASSTFAATNNRDLMQFRNGGTTKAGLQLRFNSSTGLYSWRWSGTNGPNITGASWTRIDFKSIFNGINITTDWAINGTAQTQNVTSSTLTTVSDLRFGSIMAGTDSVDIYWDDIVITATSTDYPIGDTLVVGLQPNNISTGSSSGLSNFDTSSAGLTPVAGDYTLIDDVPMSGGTDYIEQNTNSAGSYVHVDMNDATRSTVWGVTAITALEGAGGSANYVVKYHRTDAAEADIINSTLNITAGTKRFDSLKVPYITGALTQAEVSGLALRFGYSTSTAFRPRFSSFLLEVSGPPTSTVSKTHNVDAILKKNLSKTHNVDAILQANATNKTRTHNVDAMLTQASNNYVSSQSYNNASGVVSFGGFLWQVKPGMTAAVEHAPQGVGDGSSVDRQLLLDQLTRGFAGGLVTGGNTIDTINGNVPGWTFIVDDSGDSNTGGAHPTLPNTLRGTLRFALQQERPLWIVFAQDMTIIHGSEISAGPNKTVDGRGRSVVIGGNQSIRYKAVNWTTTTSDPGWLAGRDNTRKANIIYAYLTFDDTWQDQQSSNALNWGGNAPEFVKQPNPVPSVSTTTTVTYTTGTTFTVVNASAFPASGQASIGTLVFSYTGTTSTTFTGCTYNNTAFNVAFPSGNISIGTTVTTYLFDTDASGRKKTGSGDLVYVHHCEFFSIADSVAGAGYVGNNLTRNTIDWSLFGPNPDKNLFDQSGGIPFCTASSADNTFTCHDPATNAIVPHNLWQGQEVQLFVRDGYSMPGGFVAAQGNAGAGYYVRDVTTTTFKLSTTRINGTGGNPSNGGPVNPVTSSGGGVWIMNHDDQPGGQVPAGKEGRNGDPYTSGKGPHFGVNHSVTTQPLSVTGDYPGKIHTSVTLCNFTSMQIRCPKANAGYMHVWNNRYYHWGSPEGGSGTCGDYDDSAQVLMERNVFIPYQVGDAHNWGNYTTNQETWTVKGEASNTAALADGGSSSHGALVIKHSDEPWFAASARPGYNSSNPSASTYGSTTCVVSGSHSTADPVWLVGGTAPYANGYEKLTDFETINTMVNIGAGNKQPWTLVSTSPTKTRTHNVDVVLKKNQSKIHTIDSVLKKNLSRTHTTDVVLLKSFNRIHTADAVLLKRATQSHLVDVFLVALAGTGRTHEVDAVLKKNFSLSHTVDASLHKITSTSHTVDADLLGTVVTQHFVDAVLFSLRAKTHTTDAIMIDLRWWDQDWSFRRALKITAPKTGLPTGHPFKISLPYSNIVGLGKARADFVDVFVLRLKNNVWTPIPSQIIRTGSDIVISAGLVASITSLASSTEYYVYYGNPNLIGGVPSLDTYVPPTYPVAVGLADPSVSFTRPEEDWKNGVAQKTGATATCEFEGTSIHVIANKGMDKGIAQMSIDDEKWIDIDLFSVTTQSNVEVFARAGLSSKTHRLRIRMSGRRNPSSFGTKINFVRIEYKKPLTVVDLGEEYPDSFKWAAFTGD